MVGRFCVIGTMSLCVSAPVLAAPLQPTAKWTVDYAQSRCAASRPFGPGKDPLTLTIIPAHSGSSARLVLSNAWIELKGIDHNAAVDFLDGGKAFRTDAMPALSFGPSRAVLIIDLPVEQSARLRKASAIRIASSSILDRTLAVGSVGPLFDALDKCLADLRAHWYIGQTPAEQAAPSHDLGGLFSWSNYPSVGERRAKTNKVTARLLVDETGDVRDCLVTASTGSTALDVQTCQIFELRTKFRPAKDNTGKPMRSTVDQAINWRR